MAKTQFEYNESEHEKVLENHCTMYKNGVLLQVGDIADIGDQLKLVCNTGYEFSGNVRLFAQEQQWGYWSYLDFEIDESKKVSEDVRLKYRFLDLRNPKVHDNIILRSKAFNFLRNKMQELGFLEVTTPYYNTENSEVEYITTKEFIVSIAL